MPAMAMVLFATYRPWSTGTLDLLRLVMAFAVGFTVAAITSVANAAGVPAAPHGLVLITVGAYIITGMRTPHAIVAGGSVFFMQIAADIVAQRSVVEMVEPAVFILSANVIGCAASLSHERSARTSFLRLKLLECRADLDGLTGIPNRRAFDRAADRAFLSAAREKIGVVVAIFDVDHFKDYNDRLGHMAGDACLQRIARAAQGLARRPMDLAARIGGDEFAVLWYDASPQVANALADRIHQATGGHGIEHPDEGPCHRVTVSVGAVHVDPREATPLTAMVEADEALYEAKRGGRDRIVVRNLETE
jgi:diguanylate cyclase (GGDEF)-like protein